MNQTSVLTMSFNFLCRDWIIVICETIYRFFTYIYMYFYDTCILRFDCRMMSSVLSALNIQTFLIGIIVLFTVYKLRQRWKYKLPPGPFVWPLIGNYEGRYFFYTRVILYIRNFIHIWYSYLISTVYKLSVSTHTCFV